MTRVRKYGPLSNRAFRAVAALRSAIAMLQLWRAMRWHDKMWLLWALEDLPRERRATFAAAVVRASRSAWVFEMSREGPSRGGVGGGRGDEAGEAVTDRIDYDDAGNLDDVAIENVRMFRLEYMDDNRIWIRLYRDNKSDLVFHLEAAGKIAGTHYQD